VNAHESSDRPASSSSRHVAIESHSGRGDAGTLINVADAKLDSVWSDLEHRGTEGTELMCRHLRDLCASVFHLKSDRDAHGSITDANSCRNC
jgi:hypothetical protein